MSAVDSHFRWVLGRMATINPTRQVFGIMNSQDWPPQQIRFESFYLLSLGEEPVGKSFDSAAVPVLSHTLQWLWMIQGTDLQTGVVGRNRGDRYRTDGQMRSELLKALYPRSCQKQEWTTTGTSLNNLALVGTPLSPPEYVWWGAPDFHRTVNKENGFVYGYAAINLTDMTEFIAA